MSLASLGLDAALPPEIGSLTYLLTLYLSSNQLATLPSEICSFTRLTVLSLGDNRLTALPPDFGSLAALAIARADFLVPRCPGPRGASH